MVQQLVSHVIVCMLINHRPILQMVGAAEDSPQLLPVLLFKPAIGYGVKNPADRN